MDAAFSNSFVCGPSFTGGREAWLYSVSHHTAMMTLMWINIKFGFLHFRRWSAFYSACTGAVSTVTAALPVIVVVTISVTMISWSGGLTVSSVTHSAKV